MNKQEQQTSTPNGAKKEEAASLSRGGETGAPQLLDQAKQAVGSIADQAREQVTQQIGDRKDRAVEKIETVASTLRETGDKLKDMGPLADVATRAADGIEQVAAFFEENEIGDVVRKVERFARREPAMFLGGALAVGLLAGRFLKSSATHHTGSMGFDDQKDDSKRYDATARAPSRFGAMDTSDNSGIKVSPIVDTGRSPNATSGTSPSPTMPTPGDPRRRI